MESPMSPNCDSEEEVFFGPITFKELNKMWKVPQKPRNKYSEVNLDNGKDLLSGQRQSLPAVKFGTYNYNTESVTTDDNQNQNGEEILLEEASNEASQISPQVLGEYNVMEKSFSDEGTIDLTHDYLHILSSEDDDCDVVCHSYKGSSDELEVTFDEVKETESRINDFDSQEKKNPEFYVAMHDFEIENKVQAVQTSHDGEENESYNNVFKSEDLEEAAATLDTEFTDVKENLIRCNTYTVRKHYSYSSDDCRIIRLSSEKDTNFESSFSEESHERLIQKHEIENIMNENEIECPENSNMQEEPGCSTTTFEKLKTVNTNLQCIQAKPGCSMNFESSDGFKMPLPRSPSVKVNQSKSKTEKLKPAFRYIQSPVKAYINSTPCILIRNYTAKILKNRQDKEIEKKKNSVPKLKKETNLPDLSENDENVCDNNDFTSPLPEVNCKRAPTIQFIYDPKTNTYSEQDIQSTTHLGNTPRPIIYRHAGRVKVSNPIFRNLRSGLTAEIESMMDDSALTKDEVSILYGKEVHHPGNS